MSFYNFRLNRERMLVVWTGPIVIQYNEDDPFLEKGQVTEFDWK